MSASLRLAAATTSSACGTGPAQPRAVDLDDEHLAVRRGRRSCDRRRPRPNPLACRPVVMSSIANSWSAHFPSAARVMGRTIPPSMPPSGPDVAICRWRFAYTRVRSRSNSHTESYPLPPPPKHAVQLIRGGAVVLATACIGGLLVEPGRRPAPTIVPAQAAASPAGHRRHRRASCARCAGHRPAAVFDPATGVLVVLSPGLSGASRRSRWCPRTAPRDRRRCPAPATAMTGDDDGRCTLSTRGGYFRVDIARRHASARVDIEGQAGTDFTAIARRADGKLVLGSADGAVLHLELRHRPSAHRTEDLRTGGCPCRTRQHGRRAGPRRRRR